MLAIAVRYAISVRWVVESLLGLQLLCAQPANTRTSKHANKETKKPRNKEKEKQRKSNKKKKEQKQRKAKQPPKETRVTSKRTNTMTADV